MQGRDATKSTIYETFEVHNKSVSSGFSEFEVFHKNPAGSAKMPKQASNNNVFGEASTASMKESLCGRPR